MKIHSVLLPAYRTNVFITRKHTPILTSSSDLKNDPGATHPETNKKRESYFSILTSADMQIPLV